MEITALGPGYVGTVAAASLAASGRSVLGIDIDPESIGSLQSGITPFYEARTCRNDPAVQWRWEPALCTQRRAGRPPGRRGPHHQSYPQTTNGGAALKQVRSALHWIKSRQSVNTVVVMKSAVPPGTGQRIEAMAAARLHLPSEIRLTANVLEAADQAQALVLMTELEQFVGADWQDMARCMRPPRYIFDGRNALDATAMGQIGFQYEGMGGRDPSTETTPNFRRQRCSRDPLVRWIYAAKSPSDWMGPSFPKRGGR